MMHIGLLGSLLLSPLAGLVGLAALSLLARQILTAGNPAPPASGAIVMALGIFALAGLQQTPLRGVDVVSRAFALELLVIWGCIAASQLRSWGRGTLGLDLINASNRFGIGTWVAGTSVTGLMILFAFPEWRPLVEGMAVVAVALWIWYMALAIPGMRRIFSDIRREDAKGWTLLTTVSTQSLLILAVALYPQDLPSWAAAGVLALGLLFYVACTCLIVARYAGRRLRNLENDWHDTNCIVHGAMSITGLAAVDSLALTGNLMLLMWLWAAAMFAVVESIELVRAGCRVKAYGWMRGVFSYNVAQWARNFTFGMFYAFTLQLRLGMPNADGHRDLRTVWMLISDYGQYVVLGLLLIEIALFLGHTVHLPSPRRSLPAHDSSDWRGNPHTETRNRAC